ncbi:hypothetical protein IC575_023480 [Cucumis melo]
MSRKLRMELVQRRSDTSSYSADTGGATYEERDTSDYWDRRRALSHSDLGVTFLPTKLSGLFLNFIPLARYDE